MTPTTISDLHEAAQAACEQIGIIYQAKPIDGAFHTLDVVDKSPKNGAGRIRLYADGEGGQVWNHVTGDSLQFWAKSEKTFSSAEVAERQQRTIQEREQTEALLAEERAAAAKLAFRIWKVATPTANSMYFARKQVAPTDTIREMPLDELVKMIGYHPAAKGVAFTGDMVQIIPVSSGAGIRTIEMIDETGLKSGLRNGQKKGGFWSSHKLPSGDGTEFVVGIGEGVSTMLTYSMVGGNIGIAALSCGNLVAVAKYFRGRYPAAHIEIVSDVGNGEQSALEAARVVDGYLIKPAFADSSSSSDINDLHTASGLQAVKDCIQAARQIEASETPVTEPTLAKLATLALATDVWVEPQPIESQIESLPYPIDALPVTIRLAVEEVLGFVKAPIPLVVSASLSALSMAVQSHADVARAEKLSGPSSLFLLTIADSGERKSTCDGFFTAAIRDYEAKQAETAKPVIKQYEAEYAAWDAKHKGITDSIRQAAKSGQSTDELETDMLQLQMDKPESPRVPRIIYGDATPAALKYSLAKGWPSGAVVSSEAGIVFGGHGMKKDSAMENLATLNQLWDGTDQPTERRATESYTVKGARFTMSLMIQEATLRAFFKQDGGLARGTGFLARFLIAWPESTQGFRPFTEAPENWARLAAYNSRISAILKQDAPITEDGALKPAMLTLSPEAKAAWVEFHDAIEIMLASGGELFDIRDVASKTADNAARLACLFHVFSGDAGSISLDAFESASSITAWHLNEARRFFGGLALPQELVDASRLDEWMLEYCRQHKSAVIPITKVQQYGPCGLRSKIAIDAAMEELEGLDRARRVKEGKRKSIYINPALLRGKI
ncbi:MAG: DUF3987 domain-containing protein [Desulfuromonadales bacterium]